MRVRTDLSNVAFKIYYLDDIEADDYDTTTSYEIGDYCEYNGFFYQCTSATSGTWNKSKWRDIGEYFEDVIPDYNTLSVTGREVIPKEIVTYSANRGDGLDLNYTKYPTRDITFSYMIAADNETALQEKFEKLAAKLDQDEVRIIFNDEPDKYLVGTPVMNNDLEIHSLLKRGTFKITCLDPFKYSLFEKKVSSYPSPFVDGADPYDTTVWYQVGDQCVYENQLYTCNTTTAGSFVSQYWDAEYGYAFTTVNNGGYITYPRFEVQFATSEDSSGNVNNNADCGFIQLAVNEGEYRLQFGDDSEDEEVAPVTRFNKDFSKGSLGDFVNQTVDTTIVLGGTYTDKDQAAAGTGKGIVPRYGTQNKAWHGAYLMAPATASGDFYFEWKQLFGGNKAAKTAKAQKGVMIAAVLDSSNNVIAAIKLTKSSSKKTKGTVKHYVGTTEKYSTTVDFKCKGKFGFYTKKQKKKKKKKGKKVTKVTTKYIKRLTKNYIQRKGDKLYIKLACDKSPRTYTIGDTAVAKVAFFLGKYSSDKNLTYNWITNAKFIDGQPINTFNSGDFLTFDCNDASVELNTQEAEDLGDVGNDWSNFYLTRGVNIVYVAWSSWVNSSYLPTCTMYYRERWI